MRKRILTLGSANIDLMLKMDSIPSADQIEAGTGYEYVPGGKGGIAALTFARLGGDSVFCTRLGSDDNAVHLINYYKDVGVDTRFITQDRDLPTGFSVVMLESNGTRRAISYEGAINNFGKEDLESAFVCYPDAVFLQFDIADRDIVAATRLAKRQEIPVFIDAGPSSFKLPLELLENVEIFTLDEDEAYAYTDIYPSDPEKCLKTCMALAGKVNAKYIVLKLGRRGSFIYDGKYYFVIPAYDTTPVDPDGAGSVFSAAVTLEYLRHGDIQKACGFANLAGALSVACEGAYRSVPTREDVRRFADRLGVQLL